MARRVEMPRVPELHVLMAFETLNLVDGSRSGLDIYRLVAATGASTAVSGGPGRPEIIVATARSQGAAVVTKDRKIREYVHVRSIW